MITKEGQLNYSKNTFVWIDKNAIIPLPDEDAACIRLVFNWLGNAINPDITKWKSSEHLVHESLESLCQIHEQ